jgi:hypothetical protein
VYADLTGLSQKTLYYYRISATNGSGTSKGAELTFETGCLATGDAGQISGPATVVADGTTQYIYTVPAIDNATNYIWSFPQPSEIFAGDGTNTVTVIFFPSAVSGDASVFATNACDLEGGSSTYAITVSDVPENRTVTGSVGASVTNCYDATNTITVAGGITTFEVLSGGSASFKAGVKISYLPGTTVWAGGYMHGQILPTGPWCSAKSPLKEAGNEEKSLDIMDNTFRIYPNPTTGNFTVEQINGSVVEYATVDILGMLGKKIVASDLTGVSKKEFSIKGHPAGIYFVRITAGEKVQTVKIILTN